MSFSLVASNVVERDGKIDVLGSKYYSEVSTLEVINNRLELVVNENSLHKVSFPCTESTISYVGIFKYEYKPSYKEEEIYKHSAGKFAKRFDTFTDLLLFMKEYGVDEDEGLLEIIVNDSTNSIVVCFKHAGMYELVIDSVEEYLHYVGKEPERI